MVFAAICMLKSQEVTWAVASHKIRENRSTDEMFHKRMDLRSSLVLLKVCNCQECWVCRANRNHCACMLRIMNETGEGDKLAIKYMRNKEYASGNLAGVRKRRKGDGCFHHRQQEQLADSRKSEGGDL
jgi:hypothetical protein